MTKRILLLISIIFIATFTSSCKTPVLDLELFLFEAEGSYSSSENKSYIKLNSWVKINQSTVNINPAFSLDPTHFAYATVNDWEFLIYEGENLVMDIRKNNIDSVFDDICLNTSSEQYDYLWVAIVSENLIPGDIYEGKNPDSAEVRMSISDDNGEVYFFTQKVPFIFERK